MSKKNKKYAIYGLIDGVQKYYLGYEYKYEYVSSFGFWLTFV